MHDLEKRVLRIIGEDPDNPDVFTDTDAGIAPIRDALNDAIQEIVALTGANKRQYLLPLRSAQQFYRIDLQSGYLGWIVDVWLVNKRRRLEQTGLMKLTRYDPRWMISNADPRAYFPIGNDLIGLYPKPSGSEEMLEITVVEIPGEYTDENDKIKLKEDFKYAAVQYAVAEYWASRGDADEAVQHFNLYSRALNLREDFTIAPYQKRTFDTQKESVPTETT